MARRLDLTSLVGGIPEMKMRWCCLLPVIAVLFQVDGSEKCLHVGWCGVVWCGVVRCCVE